MSRYKMTLTLESAGTAEVLRRAAHRLGFVTRRGGRMQNQGNVSGLLSALATGRVSGVDLEAALVEARREDRVA